MDLKNVLNTASEIAASVVAAEAPDADQNASWVKKSMDALRESKLTGLVVPQSSGGMGHGLYALVRVCEVLGASYSSAGLCFGMHCVGSAVIAAKATAWQKQNYLEPIAAGKHITTLAVSEAGTGAHFYFPQTSLVSDAGKYIVNGEKTFVTNGSFADSYVISTMAVDKQASSEQFSVAILDSDTKGMSWGPAWDGLGMRGNSSRSLTLSDVSIGPERILGEKNDQLWYVFNVIAPYFLSAMAGTYLGVAVAGYNEALQTVRNRSYSHSGAKLSQVALVQHKLGQMYEKLEAARALLYHAAEQADHGSEDALTLILSIKTASVSCAIELINEAMTLAGGIGYRSNSRLGMLMRDARAGHVMSPTTDLLYTWMGRALLDQPLLSD